MWVGQLLNSLSLLLLLVSVFVFFSETSFSKRYEQRLKNFVDRFKRSPSFSPIILRDLARNQNGTRFSTKDYTNATARHRDHWLLLGVLLLSPAAAEASYFTGVMALAGLAPDCASSPEDPYCFPCDALLATLDFAPQPATAVVDGTFGDDWSCMARLAARYWDKPHLIEVHLTNETCRDHGLCFEGELFPQFNADQWNEVIAEKNKYALQAIADRLQNISATLYAIRNQNTYVILSLGLEERYSAAARAVLYPFIRDRWPHGPIVWSAAPAGAVLQERHGRNAKNAFICTEDGDVQSVKQSRKFRDQTKDCFVSMFWRPEHQGRDKKTNRFGLPPRLRVKTYTPQQVVELGGLLKGAL